MLQSRRLLYAITPISSPQKHYSKNITIDSQGLLSAWAINNALPHKNLRVRVLIRDAQGVPLHESRPVLTFIRDANLEQAEYIGRKTTGHHGYRYQIPADVLDHSEGQRLKVELVIYADGKPMEVAHLHSLDYTMGGFSNSN